VTVGPQPEAAAHHDSARHDEGAGFPAVHRPSADSSRRRATSPDWFVAGSSESTVSLPRPRFGKDAATNHLLSRVGVAATSRYRNVRLILRGARRDGSRHGKNRLGWFSFPAVASESARSVPGEGGSGLPTFCRLQRTTTRAGHLAMPGPVENLMSSGGRSGGRRTPAEAAPFAQRDRPDDKRQGAAEAARIDLGDGDLGEGAVLDRRGDGTALDRP